MKLSDFALEYCAVRSIKPVIWYGNPWLLQDIYDSWGGQHSHPLNSIGSVISSCARSDKWQRTGYITHMGRRYPCYAPRS